MPHTPSDLTFADVSPEAARIAGVGVARERSAASLARTQRRGGLLGQALSLGEQGRRQQLIEQQAGAGRFTTATERQEEIGAERREFRREEFQTDIQRARQREELRNRMNVDAISDFLQDVQKAGERQVISDIGALGLSAIFVGLAPTLGLTTREAIGIGANLGATIGGVAPSAGVQTAISIGGGLAGRSRAGAESRGLTELADRNEAIANFAAEHGFVPVIGEEFRP
ncbi:hypothetical protein LCGC14_0450780 [marine sediment metagenome]|uniref:Uncharacterized protein n=1 Tax=marine sediment metagenome TaxID=412755 RepID=A0A0F9T0Z8_9ZZZZ